MVWSSWNAFGVITYKQLLAVWWQSQVHTPPFPLWIHHTLMAARSHCATFIIWEVSFCLIVFPPHSHFMVKRNWTMILAHICTQDSSAMHSLYWVIFTLFNISPPGENGCHFADDSSRCIFVNEKFCIWIKNSLKFVPRGPIDNKPALV